MKLARPISRRFTSFSSPLKPDRVTKNPLSIKAAKELHAYLIRTQRPDDQSSISSVIGAYCLAPFHLHKAHLVFNQIKQPTLLNFNLMIRGFSQSSDTVVWRILLSACKLHGNVVLAEIATNKLLELDPSNSGNYVLLSNTYASSDRWDAATKMRELMEGNNVQKPSSWSSIEVNR